MVSPDAAPGLAVPAPDVPAPDVPAANSPAPVAPSPAAGGASAREPVLPVQSPEDTDAAWGEYPSRDDDRLYRDRPPHWDDIG
jgi:hypothetical protein